MHGWTGSVKCCSRLKRILLSLHSSRNRFRNSSNEKKKKSFSRHFLERKIRDALVAHRKASHGTSASRSGVTNLGRFIESAYSSSCFAFKSRPLKAEAIRSKGKSINWLQMGHCTSSAITLTSALSFSFSQTFKKDFTPSPTVGGGKAVKGENFRSKFSGLSSSAAQIYWTLCSWPRRLEAPRLLTTETLACSLIRLYVNDDKGRKMTIFLSLASSVQSSPHAADFIMKISLGVLAFLPFASQTMSFIKKLAAFHFSLRKEVMSRWRNDVHQSTRLINKMLIMDARSSHRNLSDSRL